PPTPGPSRRAVLKSDSPHRMTEGQPVHHNWTPTSQLEQVSGGGDVLRQRTDGGISLGGEFEDIFLFPDFQPADAAVTLIIERGCKTQDRSEVHGSLSIGLRQPRKALVIPLRQRPGVIASHKGHNLAVHRAPSRVVLKPPDELIGALLVILAALGASHVVHQ